MVCASSMKMMIGLGEDFTSSISPFNRFSNSPFTLAPACSRAKSSVRTVTFFNGGGTSPLAMRMAKPSTTAVLPTPASPVRIGLFCRRRIRISTTCRISASRPSTGSILPAFARSVKFTVNWSRFGDLLGGFGPPAPPAPPPPTASAGATSSDVPAQILKKSFRKASGAIFFNSRLNSRARLPSLSSPSKATRTWPVRIFVPLKSREPKVQARVSRSLICCDSMGLALPFLKVLRLVCTSSCRFVLFTP